MNGTYLPVSGIGTVHLQSKLRNGEIISSVLSDVLLVPELGEDSLFSWTHVSKKGFRMIGTEEGIEMEDSNGKKVLWAESDGGTLVIQTQDQSSETEYNAQVSLYEHWHAALGHPSVAALHSRPDLYSDSHLLPKPP